MQETEMTQVCHVKGCGKEASGIEWFPAFGCCLAFCKVHSATPEPSRADWVIELVRAKQEHDDELRKTCAEFGV